MNAYAPPPQPPVTGPPIGYASRPGGQAPTESPAAMPRPPVLPDAGPVVAAGAVAAALLVLVALVMVAQAVVTTRVVSGGTAAVQQALVAPAFGDRLLSAAPSLLQPLCGIAFATWLLIALRTARAWGTPLRRGPGWAFGAWFVPVVNLWWPKQLLDDVWRGSHPSVPPGTRLDLVPRPSLGYLWWGTWLLAPLLVTVGTVRSVVPLVGQVVAAARSGAAASVPGAAGASPLAALPPGVDLVGFVEATAIWSLWGSVLWTVCALAAAALVVQVSWWQRDRLRLLAGDPGTY